MEDGTYRVVTSYFCAGFIMFDGVCVSCAPILRKKFNYWIIQAVLIKDCAD